MSTDALNTTIENALDDLVTIALKTDAGAAPAGDPLAPIDDPPQEREAPAADAPATAVEGDTRTTEGVGGTIAHAAGTGLAHEMVRNTFASDLAKAENGLLSYGFDQGRAWQEVAALNAYVARCEAAWNRCKADTKTAKEDYDDAVEALTRRIDALDEERRKPKLALEGAEPMTGPGRKPCTYEARTGKACPTCSARLTGPAAVPTEDQPEHPGHPEHDRAATDAEAKLFIAQLEDAEVFLELVEVTSMDLSARAALEQWLRERAVIGAAQVAAGDTEVVPLPFLEAFARKAHVAGEPDTTGGAGQACTRCGRQLLDDVDIADDGTYPVGAHVGLDCEGAHEVARPIAKRGRAKKTRVRPEDERAAQLAAGREAAEADAGGDDPAPDDTATAPLSAFLDPGDAD